MGTDTRTQARIDAYLLHAKANYPELDLEQAVAFVMFNFNLFYDEAKILVKESLKHKARKEEREMKALQRYNKDLDKWEYVYSFPLDDDEAKEELKRQRNWARVDGRDTKYRAIKVVFGNPGNS